jgi:hypothetical protein
VEQISTDRKRLGTERVKNQKAIREGTVIGWKQPRERDF